MDKTVKSQIMTKDEKLAIPYQVKSNLASYKEIDEAGRTIKAVANTYNYFDYDYDVLRDGAAKKSIIERGARSKAHDKIMHALFHDLTKIVGRSENEAEIMMEGNPVLYVESYLPETTDGEDTLIKYISKMYNQHSIGFNYVHLEFIEEESDAWDEFLKDLINPEDAIKAGFGWNIWEINWHEWSTVARGANKLTPYLGVKTENKSVLLQNVFMKMNALIEKAKRFDVKNKKLFELQYKQLQQMIYEMTTIEPSKKDIAKKQPSKVDIRSESGINYERLAAHL